MDELDWARAELAQLEAIERTCLAQLLAARTAVKTQRIHIEELIKKRDPVIYRLPAELLVRIFGCAMVREERKPNQFDVIRERRRNLTSVSRLWRDVMLNTPNLWSDIGLTSLRDQTPLVTQLRRSQGVLLDITITDEAEYPDIERLLIHLLPTTNRWRSLHIYNVVDIPNLTAIIYQFSELPLPSLIDLYVDMQHPGNGEYPDPHHLLRWTPALKHVKLGNFVATDDFSTCGRLETLELIFADGFDIPPTFSSLIPAYSLITLSLVGRIPNWALKRNSIYFPLLEKLTLDIPRPERFLDAIFAPNLRHFHYMDNKSVWDAFGMYGLKFCNVHHLTFDATSFSVSQINGTAFCQGFPNTRYAALHSNSLPFFFTTIPMWLQAPIDKWASLETLTILDSGIHTKGFVPLLQWLELRQVFDFPKLHIKLTGDPLSPLDATELSILYSKLKNLCVLELDCLPLSPAAHLTRTTGLPHLILPAIEPDLLNDIFWVPTK